MTRPVRRLHCVGYVAKAPLPDATALQAVEEAVVVVGQLGKSQPNNSTLHLLRQTFETGGVIFTNGDEPGVKLKKPR
jgi:hypothetical protein